MLRTWIMLVGVSNVPTTLTFDFATLNWLTLRV
jgi:hypothetical protein